MHADRGRLSPHAGAGEAGGGGCRGGVLAPDVAADGEGPPDIAERRPLRDGIDEALTRFAEANPRQAQVLTLRVFMDRTTVEVAEILGIGSVTVEQDLREAIRALLAESSGGGPDDPLADLAEIFRMAAAADDGHIDDPSDQSGSTIDRYTLVRRIGIGAGRASVPRDGPDRGR